MPASKRYARKSLNSDCADKTSWVLYPSLSIPACNILFISFPPIPHIVTVSTSPLLIPLSPSQSCVVILSESPYSSMCSCARLNGSFLTSHAYTLLLIPFWTRYIGRYAWSVPISATLAPLLTRLATHFNLLDILIISFISFP